MLYMKIILMYNYVIIFNFILYIYIYIYIRQKDRSMKYLNSHVSFRIIINRISKFLIFYKKKKKKKGVRKEHF